MRNADGQTGAVILLVTFTRTMPFSFSHVFKTLLQNKVVYLPLKLLCSICLFFQKEANPEKYSHNITHNKVRLQAQGLTVDVGLWCRRTSPQCCDKWQRRGIMSQPKIHFLPHTLFLFSPLNSDTVSYRKFKKALTNV